ncbi:acylase [Cellulophaga lytica]|uniref:Glutaryl-7-aminocephalosporanic-acid acylase n=1 Tax=Cellulophaga lytica (strain ATCC 23178 / DSM 7489 / JCM 8516 / NBRC 14961 / NCIMB 1423 / VKM B-1433 / Cy l20) TaxID=867900 RepID=F0RD21_CELLC|nr:acylase [Cellulophaga lytica]ADY28708.1 Glutaryl-7-aminocephalosporanic-acid acylase [Cellulophaga lytica DSM 7489]AIM59755.1 penicillin amidase [Cellulophaga lytica]WQG77113.1 acylase [Cellulophaga lytica]
MKISIYTLVFFSLLVGCKQATKQNKNVDRWQAHADNTTIIRDTFGVPHIYGKTDADAVFGLLYAQCEDDFNRVEQNYIWATGRLAEVDGEEALYSDLRAKLFMTEEEAIANYNKSPEWLKELCNAFADGINYYLHTHPEVTPRLLTKFEPWMPMYFSEGSIGGDIERISTRKIKAFYEGDMEIPEATELKIEEEKAELEPQGSNGIAISGNLTQSGNAMLLINPHTSFFFRGEVHVVSEEGLNAYGAVTWGQFFVYQGFNEKTGWMHTSTYTDVMDEFKETIVNLKGDLKYQYGEELRDVVEDSVTLKYKSGESIKQKTFKTYRTHHGPITHKSDGKWTASAMMWEPVKALEQSYIRTKQNGYKGFREMMNIRTNSSNNTVYADAGGNIAYFHGNFVPVRDTVFDFTKPVDGSNPQTDWKGLHTVDENILLLNPKNGWLQNCNSTPYTAALENSPKRKNYPKYMSKDQENFRGVHAIRLLTDKKEYTLDSLIKLAHDPYLPAFKALIPGLVEAYDTTDKTKLLSLPIEELRNWDFKTSKESVAMTLAHYYGTMYGRNGKRPRKMSDMEAMIYFGSASPMAERLSVFRAVIKKLESDFGTWNIPWGEVNRYQRLNGDIKQAFNDDEPSVAVGFASGRWGALAAYGVSYTNNTKKIYGTRGNSFVAAVEFGEKVKAKTILAGGQSGDPASAHFNDQTDAYINMQFKTVAFYKDDVLKQAEKTYHPGEVK